ncbi:MAG: hypothetical protein ACRC10_10520 [Thermoguttaceae bacterium]
MQFRINDLAYNKDQSRSRFQSDSAIQPAPITGKISFYPGEKSAVLATLRSLFGPLPSCDVLRSLIGARRESQIYLGTLEQGFYAEHYEKQELGVTGFCEIRRMISGELLMRQEIQILRRDRQNGGIGQTIFHKQTTTCRDLGISRIYMWARRTSLQIGYYVLPRFGFCGTLPLTIRSQLPLSFQNCQRIEEIFEQDAGKKWWKEHGISFPEPLVFRVETH